MALSYEVFEGDGVQSTFLFHFDYLRAAHLQVFIDGGRTQDFAVPQPNTIVFDTPPPVGSVITIRRVTPTDSPIVDFVDGSVLSEADLDASTLQSLYISQETSDDAGRFLRLGDSYTFEADGLRISDIAPPVNPNDVASKTYVDHTLDAYLTTFNSKVTEASSLLAETTAAKNATIAIKDNSALSAAESEAHSLNSGLSAADSLSYATEARQWAIEDEDVEIETNRYSARHYAAKARELIENGSASLIHASSGNGLTATNVQGQLDELNNIKAFIDEPVFTETVSSSTYALDYSVAQVWALTLNNDVTLSIVNPPSNGGSLAVKLIQSGGTYVPSFSVAGLKWSNDATPEMPTKVNDYIWVVLVTPDGGLTWTGFEAGKVET